MPLKEGGQKTMKQNHTDAGRRVSRRGLLKSGLAFPAIVPSTVLGAFAPSNRVNLGHLGVGGRGSALAKAFASFPDVRYVAVCDAYAKRREAKRAEWNNLYGGDYVTAYPSPFELLQRKDVDAVVISTPDHWHVPLAIAAARAGKDMYVEKPLGVAMAWAKKLRQAVLQSKSVFQYGTQQRSSSQFRYACEVVRNGYLGKLQRIETWCPDISEQYDAFHVKKYGSLRPIQPPADLDFDLWCGPSPKRAYTADRCTQYGTYHIYDYALGFIAGWGAHPLDIAQWALGADDTSPVYYEGAGTLPKVGLYDTVDNWDITCYYADGLPMRFMSERIARDVVMKYRGQWVSHGTTFFGSEGWLSVDRRAVEASRAALERIEFKPGDTRLYQSPGQERNFIDCVKSRRQAISPLEAAIRSDTISHLGDIMIRTGRPIQWDPKSETIVGDAEAARLLDRPVRREYSSWATT